MNIPLDAWRSNPCLFAFARYARRSREYQREISKRIYEKTVCFLVIVRLSWLRQQQLKLAARRDERNPGKLWRQETGNRVIGELRSLQRGRLRHDGYASDSAVLDDDDDTWAGGPISGQVRAIRNIWDNVRSQGASSVSLILECKHRVKKLEYTY